MNTLGNREEDKADLSSSEGGGEESEDGGMSPDALSSRMKLVVGSMSHRLSALGSQQPESERKDDHSTSVSNNKQHEQCFCMQTCDTNVEDEWQAQSPPAQLGHFIFSSNFDSGNGGKIVKVAKHKPPNGQPICTNPLCYDPWEYHVWVAPDCHNSPYVSTCKTWFYFRIRATQRPQVRKNMVHPIHLVIRGMQNQGKLYREHYGIFMRLPEDAWRRVPNTSGNSTSGSADTRCFHNGLNNGLNSVPIVPSIPSPRITNGGSKPIPAYKANNKSQPTNPQANLMGADHSLKASIASGIQQQQAVTSVWEDPSLGGTGLSLYFVAPVPTDGTTVEFAFCVPYANEDLEGYLARLERQFEAYPSEMLSDPPKIVEEVLTSSSKYGNALTSLTASSNPLNFQPKKYSRLTDSAVAAAGETLASSSSKESNPGAVENKARKPVTVTKTFSGLNDSKSVFEKDDGDLLYFFPTKEHHRGSTLPRKGKNVYLKIEPLCKSLCNRTVYLMTITDRRVFTFDPYDQKNDAKLQEALQSRAAVLLSARVHPGETPGQFAFLGMLQFLLSDDVRAETLRRTFVFRMIPVLNPDGVALGHYRMNSRGQNLNRFYSKSSSSEHEAVHHMMVFVKKVLGKNLFFYLDCHGHASKRGCFIFGNNVNGKSLQAGQDLTGEQAWNVVYSHLCALNSPYFETEGCNFQIKNQVSQKSAAVAAAAGNTQPPMGKDGTGRVAVHNLCNVVHSYTLECNYNSINPNSSSLKLRWNGGKSDDKFGGVNFFLDVDAWVQVGEALMISLLDMYCHNCSSRLVNLRQRSLSGYLCERHLIFRREVATFANSNPNFFQNLMTGNWNSHMQRKDNTSSSPSRRNRNIVSKDLLSTIGNHLYHIAEKRHSKNKSKNLMDENDDEGCIPLMKGKNEDGASEASSSRPIHQGDVAESINTGAATSTTMSGVVSEGGSSSAEECGVVSLEDCIEKCELMPKHIGAMSIIDLMKREAPCGDPNCFWRVAAGDLSNAFGTTAIGGNFGGIKAKKSGQPNFNTKKENVAVPKKESVEEENPQHDEEGNPKPMSNYAGKPDDSNYEDTSNVSTARRDSLETTRNNAVTAVVNNLASKASKRSYTVRNASKEPLQRANSSTTNSSNPSRTKEKLNPTSSGTPENSFAEPRTTMKKVANAYGMLERLSSSSTKEQKVVSAAKTDTSTTKAPNSGRFAKVASRAIRGAKVTRSVSRTRPKPKKTSGATTGQPK